MQNRTSISRAAQARRIVGRRARAPAPITGPHTASTSARSSASCEPAPAGQQLRMHAGLQGPAVVRAAGDEREPRPGPGGERPCGVHRARPVRQARSRDDQPASPASASRDPGERPAPPPSRAARDLARRAPPARARPTSCRRVAAGGARTTARPRAAALRSRRWRIGTSCSASRPATRIDLRALDVPVRHARTAPPATSDSASPPPASRR